MYILYCVHCNTQLLSLGSLVLTTDVELYKNMADIVYNSNTLL